MGAAKNIFGALTNVVDKAKSGVKSVFKSADSKVIKTTSKTLGSSAPAISGGRSVVKETASNFVKGAGSTAKIGGKVVAGTGIFAIPAAAGLYGYDVFKNVLARNSDYYSAANDNKNYAQESQNLKDRIEILQNAQKNGIDGNNGLNGADGTNYLEGGSVAGTSSDDTSNSNVKYYVIGAIVLIAAGTYIYSKKMKGGKN